MHTFLSFSTNGVNPVHISGDVYEHVRECSGFTILRSGEVEDTLHVVQFRDSVFVHKTSSTVGGSHGGNYKIQLLVIFGEISCGSLLLKFETKLNDRSLLNIRICFSSSLTHFCFFGCPFFSFNFLSFLKTIIV